MTKYLCDYATKTLKEVPEFKNFPPQPTVKYDDPQHSSLWKQYEIDTCSYLDTMKQYPMPSMPAEWDGQVKELGKDFEIEEQFWEGASWWPTFHLVDKKVREGTKVRVIAIQKH